MSDTKKTLMIMVATAVVSGGIVYHLFGNGCEEGTCAPLPSSTKVAEAATIEPVIINGKDYALTVNKAIDYKELTANGQPVIVDYGANSCIPCKAMAPVLEKMNKEMQGKAFVKFVDVWKYSDAVSNVPVRIIPTQILFGADGKPFVPSEELKSKMLFNLIKHPETGEHVYTTHEGGLTEAQMRQILAEMGVQ